MALIDHVGHNVVSDEAELRRYPTTLTVEDGIAVIEVDHRFTGEYLGDIRGDDTGLYCTTCDVEIRVML